jgi:hypothetical protein
MRAKQPMPSDPGPPPPAGATARPIPALIDPLDAPDSASAAPQPAASSRRPYQPPRILFREPLEAMAAICSPHPPAKANKGLCPMGPISS